MSRHLPSAPYPKAMQPLKATAPQEAAQSPGQNPNERYQPRWDFLCLSFWRPETQSSPPDLPSHPQSCFPPGKPLTHLLNSKTRATGRVLSTRLTIHARAVLTFLTGTDSV